MRRYQLIRLRAELAAAGIAVDRLGYDDGRVFTYDEHGLAVELPPEADPVIAAHDPTPDPGPDYGADAADIDQQAADAVALLRAFIALTPPTQAQVVANAKLQNRVLLAVLRRLAP